MAGEGEQKRTGQGVKLGGKKGGFGTPSEPQFSFPHNQPCANPSRSPPPHAARDAANTPTMAEYVVWRRPSRANAGSWGLLDLVTGAWFPAGFANKQRAQYALDAIKLARARRVVRRQRHSASN